MASASKFVDRSNWTIFELKQELRKRKATTTGRKAVLVARLEDYDRNFDFVLKDSGIIPAPDPICNWPENGFQQIQPIHKHFLPALSREMIEGYFKYRLATDNEECTDIKALQKGKLLLESEHISACSLRISKEDVFLTGIVRASMKKRASISLLSLPIIIAFLLCLHLAANNP